jgi:hypothetical protein
MSTDTPVFSFKRSESACRQEIGKRLPRDAQALRRFGDRKAERLQALAANDPAGMGRVVHRHVRYS